MGAGARAGAAKGWRAARRAHRGGKGTATLRRRRMTAMDGGTIGMLPLSTAIHIDNGGWVTGAQIGAQPSVYEGNSTASPTEPSYGAVNGNIGRHKGKIRWRRHDGEKVLMIIDYAHGANKWYRFVADEELDAIVYKTDTDTEASAEA